jgi:predicted AAA+ superfamily ATPase
MNDFTLNRTKIKLINITGVYGCGKTLLIKKCLDTYFEANPKLLETLINNKDVKEYPFVINANLNFVINSDVLINHNGKDDYRGFQLVLKIMLDIIYKDNEGKKKIKNYFVQNNEIENYIKN